jgi:hypothetical protein
MAAYHHADDARLAAKHPRDTPAGEASQLNASC